MAEAVSDQEGKPALDEMVRALGELGHQIQELELQRARGHQAVDKEFGPKIDPLQQQFDALKDQITERARPQFWNLVTKGTKTIHLRSGEISHRVSPVSMKIDDEGQLRRAIWRRRLVNKLTRIKRTINTKALKDYLVAHPDVTMPGVRLERGENIVIRPGKTKAEITVSVEAGSLGTPKED